MKPEKYIIVGRQLDQHGDVKYLHKDKRDEHGNELINGDDSGDAIPLTAEFIGEQVIDLSEDGPIAPGEDKYKQVVRRIKYALAVVPPNEDNPSNEELEKILENTQVDLVWEKRDQDGDVDVNERTFVVPVPQTLADKRETLKGIVKEPGFKPPLTYFLDELMMRAYLAVQINGVIDELTDDAGVAMPDHWKEILKDRIDDVMGSHEEQEENAKGIAQKKDANILTDPVSAFHRAVGIYITNMCD